MQVRSALEDNSADEPRSVAFADRPFVCSRWHTVCTPEPVSESRFFRVLLLLGSCCLPVLGYLTLSQGRFGSSSCCTRCGIRKLTTEWQIPRARITLYSKSTQQHTAFSMMLQTNGITRAHTHIWAFVHGSGNGVRCALGKGHQLMAVQSRDVIHLIQAAHQRDDHSFRDLIIANALDPETSEATRWAAMVCSLEPSDPNTSMISPAETRDSFTNELHEYLVNQRR